MKMIEGMTAKIVGDAATKDRGTFQVTFDVWKRSCCQPLWWVCNDPLQGHACWGELQPRCSDDRATSDKEGTTNGLNGWIKGGQKVFQLVESSFLWL